ncbi:MAG TPA: PAS domain-containing protein, partial [Roseiarcus sp.]|nr:PAS domain-containing protein [Roseiarcus sp.]
MDLSGVALYWLGRPSCAPPAALRRFALKLELPTRAPDGAAIAFLPAAPGPALADIRAKLGGEALIVLVAEEEEPALIGGDVDDICRPDALAKPGLVLARLAARARERFRAARSRAALERRCAHIQAGLDALPTPIFIKDADIRYTVCNKAFQRFVGLPSEEIIGKRVYGVSRPERAEYYEATDRALLAAGGEQIYETTVRYADGSRHEVMFHKAAFRDERGAVAGMAGVMLDINQRKRAEAALHESELRYRDVFEHASDCIALIDVTADGRYILAAANPAARQACGLAKDEGLEQPV